MGEKTKTGYGTAACAYYNGAFASEFVIWGPIACPPILCLGRGSERDHPPAKFAFFGNDASFDGSFLRNCKGELAFRIFPRCFDVVNFGEIW